MLSAENSEQVYDIDDKWDQRGHPPLVKDLLLDQYGQSLAHTSGQKFMKEKVNELLRDALAKRGHVYAKSKTFNRITLQNYLTILVKRRNLSLIDNSTGKNNARYMTENSLIGAFCHLLVIAMTHFYVVEEKDVIWAEKISQLDEDDLVLYRLMGEFRGNKPIQS